MELVSGAALALSNSRTFAMYYQINCFLVCVKHGGVYRQGECAAIVSDGSGCRRGGGVAESVGDHIPAADVIQYDGDRCLAVLEILRRDHIVGWFDGHGQILLHRHLRLLALRLVYVLVRTFVIRHHGVECAVAREILHAEHKGSVL